MYPLLNETLARWHQKELQDEATMGLAVHQARIETGARSSKNEWQSRMRMISFGAFSLGMLLGSALGSVYGLLPAVILGSCIAVTISVSILKRVWGI